MGTLYNVKLVDYPAGLVPDEIRTAIDQRLEAINLSMSTYLPDSELSRFNADRTTQWHGISDQLLDVLEIALAISRETGGAFDITVGPLVNLWGFGPTMGDNAIPSGAQIEAARARVGYGKLEVRQSPPAVRKTVADVYIDLSAIAKGYAVDSVADFLDKHGIANYLVEIGGEVRAQGHNARGQAWRIAVEKPLSDSRVVHRVLGLDDSGLATSGDYRNYFEKDGRRYSHTIDPVSGRPVGHSLVSVTVAHPSAMHADALATALMVLGPEAGYEFAERRGLAALFIVAGEDGFHDRVTTAFNRHLVAVRD